MSASSESDPLISLSYLEKIVLPSFKAEIMNEITGTAVDLTGDALLGEANENATEVSAPVADNAESADGQESTTLPSATYTLIELSQGELIMAESICEFIVRPGSHVACVSPFEAQGIADITNGKEVLDGEEVSINAYCLIPRGGDGRGLKVVGEKAYIMIRGDYTIV